ncbi:hypothetical protein BH24ACT8_BH24ACT8_19310 [soil metagenome]|jgi:hypothetical protein
MRSLMAALALTMTIPGCGPGLPGGAQEVGERVDAWVQQTGDDDSLERMDRALDPGGTLLLDEAGRDAFLETIPPDSDANGVIGVDLDSNVLVVGSYGQCVLQDRVLLDRETGRIWFDTYVEAEDEGTACEWSPLAVVAWAVPHSELGDNEPTDLVPGPPPEPTD